MGDVRLPTAPRVSVVVPVWDRERFLGACLDSILGQTREPDEVIVVDDGSTDASVAVAERRAGVQVIARPHEGLPATRNVGIRAATGDLVAFCDSDDTWHPDRLRRQVEHLEREPGCDAVLCRNETVREPGVPAPAWLRADRLYGDLDGIGVTSGLYRRELFDHVAFRDDVALGEGFDLLVQVRETGHRIDVLDDKLWTRRIHGQSLMDARSDDARLGMLRSVRRHLHAARPDDS